LCDKGGVTVELKLFHPRDRANNFLLLIVVETKKSNPNKATNKTLIAKTF